MYTYSILSVLQGCGTAAVYREEEWRENKPKKRSRVGFLEAVFNNMNTTPRVKFATRGELGIQEWTLCPRWMFTPLFTPRGKHSLHSVWQWWGEQRIFIPGYNLVPRVQSSLPVANSNPGNYYMSPLGAKLTTGIRLDDWCKMVLKIYAHSCITTYQGINLWSYIGSSHTDRF
jgi:hypothetical protein